MKEQSDLIFELIDLPPEGVNIRGSISFAELDIADEERFSFPESLNYDLSLAPCGGKSVLLRGQLQATMTIVCDRCNAPGKLALAVDDVCHSYEDAYGRVIDLTPDIREDILIAFPQKFLCHSNCPGLCVHCGQNLREGSCDCAARMSPSVVDDPWRDLERLHLS
jgi:uncharacterized metal-binding protein YceD (DUF177 family)